MFLEVDSLDDIKKKFDMVMIFRAMNPNFDHVRDHILIGQEVHCMENLTT